MIKLILTPQDQLYRKNTSYHDTRSCSECSPKPKNCPALDVKEENGLNTKYPALKSLDPAEVSVCMRNFMSYEESLTTINFDKATLIKSIGCELDDTIRARNVKLG